MPHINIPLISHINNMCEKQKKKKKTNKNHRNLRESLSYVCRPGHVHAATHRNVAPFEPQGESDVSGDQRCDLSGFLFGIYMAVDGLD